MLLVIIFAGCLGCVWVWSYRLTCKTAEAHPGNDLPTLKSLIPRERRSFLAIRANLTVTYGLSSGLMFKSECEKGICALEKLAAFEMDNTMAAASCP
ncbi:hypothetical protein Ancab_014633 [Ancistrocladus abbreviatus]